jgi:hypothetical protein
MSRYIATGKERRCHEGGWKAFNDSLNARLAEATAHPVACRSCGRRDNDWPPRHGLCCNCWCRLLNRRLAQGMTLAEAEADAGAEADAMQGGAGAPFRRKDGEDRAASRKDAGERQH